MPDITVHVSFIVRDEAKFFDQIKAIFEHDDNVVGFRTGVEPENRTALQKFSVAMEAKLRKNDHKKSWDLLPVEALFRLLMIEIEEFRVAKEFLTVAEARNELVDCGNYSLILWDRLKKEKQDEPLSSKIEGGEHSS